jgi:ribosome-binding factor A
MPREFPRARRIADSIQRVLAPLIEAQAREHGFGLLTLTGVDVSPDLRNANLYVSCLQADAEPAAVLRALVPGLGRMRHRLAAELQMRSVPLLHLRYDDTAARGARLEALLHGIEPDRAADPDAPAGGRD